MCLQFLAAIFGADVDSSERQSEFEDVPFQDFNNAWGFNNDHNWEADGDTQWDDHGEGFPGGDE